MRVSKSLIEDDLNVSMSFKELIKLLHSVDSFESIEDAVNDLYDEVRGLRSLYLETLDVLKEIKSKLS